jgi:hypothetical protein
MSNESTPELLFAIIGRNVRHVASGMPHDTGIFIFYVSTLALYCLYSENNDHIPTSTGIGL